MGTMCQVECTMTGKTHLIGTHGHGLLCPWPWHQCGKPPMWHDSCRAPQLYLRYPCTSSMLVTLGQPATKQLRSTLWSPRGKTSK